MDAGNARRLPTAGADPGSRAPAPGSLHLVQALVNTVSVELGRDLLDSQHRAAEWLATAGLLPVSVDLTEPELAALVELREAIRGVLAAHTDHHDDPAAAARLTMALARCRLAVTVDAAGDGRLVSADHDPFARALGGVAIAIADAAARGIWPQLKACPGDLCGWAFFDRSSTGRSRWCSMQLCGARSKMRVYRSRGKLGLAHQREAQS
jgi:predicted RNA-binding Zn ribbon-like protein